MVNKIIKKAAKIAASGSITGVHLPVTPAMELEGYYLGAKIESSNIFNNTTRLTVQRFHDRY